MIQPIDRSQFDIKTGFRDDDAEVSGSGFANMLKGQIRDLEQTLGRADEAQRDLAIGKSENIHEAMIASEKAEVSLKYMMQIRNKAIEAYQEILKMQF